MLADQTNPNWPLVATCLRNPAHGQIAFGPFPFILSRTGNHFFTEHGQQQSVTENVDFHLEPSPPTCDLCGVAHEPRAWAHKTPAGLVVGDADGDWYLCDRCHSLVLARDETSLVHRAVTSLLAKGGYHESYLRPIVTANVRLLVRHARDYGILVEVTVQHPAT
jgi:hypothetical protein